MNFWDVRVCALSQELGALPSAFPQLQSFSAPGGTVAQSSTEGFDARTVGSMGVPG